TLNYLVNYFKDFNISSQLKVSSLSLLLNKNDKLNIHFPPHFKISRDRISKNQTNINIDSVFLLQPNDIVETYIIYELNSDNKDQHNYISEVSKSIDECFNKNLKNWNKKISDVVSVNGKFSEKPFQQLSVKALITLTNNWRSVYKDLHHNGLFPSYSYEWFYGFWSWDSWKHAVALAKFDTKLAKEQVLAMFDYQDTLGMIPDVIYPDAIENNWRDTKPPLASWAVYNIFQASNDSNFVNLMLPKLLKYHYWWYKYRDHDNNGLCEYGSTDGTRIAASWESGMDNAVRFDDAIMLKNSENAYSLNQESVDLNSYLYAEKCYLKKMAKIVDNDSLIILLENEAKKLKDKINNTFWDKNSGYYYDVKINDKTKIMAQGPEGWIPLWARIANKEQAELVKTNILDSAKFNTKCPFPTLSKKNKKFDPQNGYWRGPVWFDQAYFAVKGLNNYGYHKIARDITLKLFNNADGLVNSNKAIRENYHPITGEGLNANNFSWTAAHILMFMDINDTIILENKQ
nr:trehalase family glycosidase [Bacteroidales bacterium]